MTHRNMVKEGTKIIEKFLTERQLRLLTKRRQVWFQVDHVKVILRPKAKNQKLLNRIERYKQKIQELKLKVK